MLYDNYGVITGFEPVKWTTGAIQCYKRGCKCEGCYINEKYRETLGNGRCCMRIAVRKLILREGLPKDIEFIEYYEGDD